MKTLEVRTFLTLFFLSGLIFLADGQGLLNLPKSALQFVTNPIQYGMYSAKGTINDTFSFITFWKSGEARIKNLELRNLELVSMEPQIAIQKKENADLRAQLGVKPLTDQKMVPATVLGLDRYLEINVGNNDGIKVGQSVVYINNLVGRIVRVTPRASFVQLPTDPQAKIPAKINTVSGLVIGQFNSSMVLDRVAQTEDISEGNFVLTTDNLIIGKISKITSLETDLFKKAEIQPLITYSDLTTVFVVQ